MTSALAPVSFDAPLVNAAPNGLWAVTQWQPESGPPRWLGEGVDIRVFNYGGGEAFGVWAAPWLASHSDLDPEDDLKHGVRPDFPDTFTAVTTWAYDEGNLMKWSQQEVLTRVEQVYSLQEPNAVEGQFATRLLADADTPTAGDDVVDALSILEAALAETNTIGLIHASARVAASAAKNNLIVRTGNGVMKTPLGHTWVFGGGYVDALGWTLVATSPVFGWRSERSVKTATKLQHNLFGAVAERSVVLGYESLVGAATIN